MNEPEQFLKDTQALAQEIVDRFDTYFEDPEPEPDKYANIIDAYWKDGVIVVEYDTNVDIDIRYWFGDKVHEVEDYIDKIDQSDGEFRIGVNEKNEDWKIQVVGDGVASKIINIGKYVEDEPIEKLEMDIGFWYDEEIPESNPLKKLCTIGQIRGRSIENARKVIDGGRKVVVSYGTFEPSDSVWKLKQKTGYFNSTLKEIGHENIYMVNLDDEPKGFSDEQLEAIVEGADEKLPVAFTFTFTRGHLLRRYVPTDLKLVGNNFYPFVTDEGIEEGYVSVKSYKDFKEHADRVYKNIRANNSNVKILMSPQVFYSGEGDSKPWRKPPLESPEWYFRYASESGDIVAFLLWEYATDYNGDLKQWIGLNEMPDLQQAWIDAINKWVK